MDAAPVGSTIFIEPGTYSEAISVAKPGLHLIGLAGPGGSEPVIENPGSEDTGITVASPSPGSTLNGFVLQNLIVRDFLENGVLLAGVNHFVVSNVQATPFGIYLQAYEHRHEERSAPAGPWTWHC